MTLTVADPKYGSAVYAGSMSNKLGCFKTLAGRLPYGAQFEVGSNLYSVMKSTSYAQLVKYCDTAHITKIDHEYEADAYFPNLDADPDWEVTGESDEETYFDLEYRFVRYERKK